jgi:hypothetical protein
MDDVTQVIPPEHDNDETAPVLPLETEGSPFSDFSLIDTFKSELDELVSAESVNIPVKGYERTGLQIKYHMPENGRELDNLSRTVSKQYTGAYDKNLAIAIATMVHLCDGLYVQPDNIPEPVMLDPEETGYPCQFDNRLADIMGMENGEPRGQRQIVRRLFGNNDLAILSHAERLSRWLQNTKADVQSELWQLGE